MHMHNTNSLQRFGLRQHWCKRKYVFPLPKVWNVTPFFRFCVLNTFGHSVSEYLFSILSNITWEPIISQTCFVFIYLLLTPFPATLLLTAWRRGRSVWKLKSFENHIISDLLKYGLHRRPIFWTEWVN